MAFEMQRIFPEDKIVNTPEYQQAVALNGGTTIFTRVIDHGRKISFYCLSTGRDEDRPPGDYVLFYQDQINQIRAYYKNRWVESVGNILTYRIYSLTLSPELEAQREQVVQAMREAFEVEGRDFMDSPTAVVNIEFMQSGAEN